MNDKVIEINAAEVLDEQLITIHGDTAKSVIETFQQLDHPWSKMSESQQQETIELIQDKSKYWIENVVKVVAAKGFETTMGVVHGVNFADGVKAVLNLNKCQGAHDLADLQGEAVVIVLGSPKDFIGSGEMPEADPDQSDILDDQAA